MAASFHRLGDLFPGPRESGEERARNRERRKLKTGVREAYKGIQSSSYVVAAWSGEICGRMLQRGKRDENEMDVHDRAIVIIVLRRKAVRPGKAQVHVLIGSHQRGDDQRKSSRK